MTSPKEAMATYRAPPALPEGMSGPTWTLISALSDTPTVRHPLGLRTAVIERSAILREATGEEWSLCDERALAEEAGVSSQQRMAVSP